MILKVKYNQSVDGQKTLYVVIEQNLIMLSNYHCALILSETLALHKSFTYLLTYLLTY